MALSLFEGDQLRNLKKKIKLFELNHPKSNKKFSQRLTRIYQKGYCISDELNFKFYVIYFSRLYISLKRERKAKEILFRKLIFHI